MMVGEHIYLAPFIQSRSTMPYTVLDPSFCPPFIIIQFANILEAGQSAISQPTLYTEYAALAYFSYPFRLSFSRPNNRDRDFSTLKIGGRHFFFRCSFRIARMADSHRPECRRMSWSTHFRQRSSGLAVSLVVTASAGH